MNLVSDIISFSSFSIIGRIGGFFPKLPCGGWAAPAPAPIPFPDTFTGRFSRSSPERSYCTGWYSRTGPAFVSSLKFRSYFDKILALADWIFENCSVCFVISSFCKFWIRCSSLS